MAIDTKANKKFLDGDRITDFELSALRQQYAKALRAVEGLGPEFKLMVNELRLRKFRLDDYFRARNEGKKRANMPGLQ